MIGNVLTRHAGIRYPILCGAMYPCSNPELVAAVSESGAMGIVQPLSMVYVHGHELRSGLRYIRSLTKNPVGLNATVEKSSRTYENRVRQWIDIGIEEGIRFFDTSLGNPRWIVDLVHQVGGVVYHKVTERKWAEKALDAGVDGLLAVNNQAGGHAGNRDPVALFDELADLGLPVVCAGGVGDAGDVVRAMKIGYTGVMMATRFIASAECNASTSYKQAIVRARAVDIVHTERVTGVPLAVIKTDAVLRDGLKTSVIVRWMLRQSRLKKFARMLLAIRSVRQLKKSARRAVSSRDYLQAGKSVEHIDSIEPVASIVRSISDALESEGFTMGSTTAGNRTRP